MEHHLQAALIMIASFRQGRNVTEVHSGEGTFNFYIDRLSSDEINIRCKEHQGANCRLRGSGSNWRFSELTHYHSPKKEGKSEKAVTNIKFEENGEFECEYYDDKPWGKHKVSGKVGKNEAKIVDYSKETKYWNL